MRTLRASDLLRASGTLSALAIISFVLGMGVETVGAPWELRIDIPGAAQHAVTDVSPNRRFAVGWYCAGFRCSGFLAYPSELTTINIPGAQDTYLFGVNTAGDVVGYSWSPDTGEFAFLRRHQGTITPISCPFSPSSRPTAINNGRTVVGTWFNSEEMRGAFRWRNGRCEQLPIDDGFVFPTDISENGIIIGGAGVLEELDPFYGFMIQRDEVIRVEHPDAPFENGGATSLQAVAPNGLILGWSSPDIGSVIRGAIQWFLYRDGVFESIDVPGPPREFHPLSISSSGVVTYEDNDDVIRAVRVTSALAH